MYSDIKSRGVQLGCAAVAAAALTAGIAAPQPGRILVPVESHLVQLQAVTVSAVENSVAASAPSAPTRPLAAATAAANTNLTDSLGTAFRFIAYAACVVATPLWWIAFPVTFPLGFAVGFAVGSNIFGLLGGISVGLAGALGGPLFFGQAIYNYFPPSAPPAAASSAAAGRSGAKTAVRNDSGAPSLRRNQASRVSVPRQANARPAATSKRSARIATAVHASNTPKAAGAASKRRSARQAD